MAKRYIDALIEDIKKDICDNYCKYPEQYKANTKNGDEAFDQMIEEICAECPLNRL